MIKRLSLRITLGTGLAIAAAGGCASTANDSDHETHWVSCKDDSDCPPDSACRASVCVDGSGKPIPRADAGSNTDSDSGSRSDGGSGSDAGSRCGPGIQVTNPTGGCVQADSGARPGYHAPGCDVWLPDCANTLSREYWRVFATSTTSAYVIPRPDGARELTGPCNVPSHPLRPLVEKYRLCEQATTQEAVDIVNDMMPSEALEITHFMHAALLFEATEGIPAVYLLPFPIPSDVLDACELHADRNSASLQTDCDTMRQYVTSGVELMPNFSETASEIARLLNELYGIVTCGAPEIGGRVCVECGVVGGCGRTEIRCTVPCSTTADCAGAAAGGGCMMGVCGPAYGCI
jgi:hypothetical protein